MARRVYVYEGREFSSIRKLSEYVNINEKTLTARLRKGMSVEEACQKADLRCSYYVDGGKEKSIAQICREQAKNADLIRNRLKYGYSLNDALNKPKKISKQGIPIVVNGILYNSIASALRGLNLLHKESTVRRRLKLGMKPDEAFQFEEG
jgi:hypothetical protein